MLLDPSVGGDSRFHRTLSATRATATTHQGSFLSGGKPAPAPDTPRQGMTHLGGAATELESFNYSKRARMNIRKRNFRQVANYFPIPAHGTLLKVVVVATVVFLVAKKNELSSITTYTITEKTEPSFGEETPQVPVRSPSAASRNPPTRENDEIVKETLPKVHQRADAVAFSDHINDQPFDPPPWMLEYVAHHQSYVDLNTGEIASDKMSSMRWLQWYCSYENGKRHCGGLADRIKGMIMALILAKVDQRVLLIEEWEGSTSTGTHPLLDYLEPNLINWTANPPNSSKAVQFETFTDNFGGLKSAQYKIIKKSPCQFKEKRKGVRFTGNVLADYDYLEDPRCPGGFWTAEKVSPYPALFWTLFRFTPLVHKEADRLRGPIIPAKRNFYVAAHIRTGNFTDHEDLLRQNGQDSWDKYAACIKAVSKAVEERCGEAPWTYVASDNVEAKKYIRNKVGSEAKVLTADIEIMHVDLHVENDEQPKDEFEATAAYRSVMGEFKVLLDSTCIIGGTSGFSRLAKYLSRQDLRCTIDFDRCDDPKKVAKKTSYIPCPES